MLGVRDLFERATDVDGACLAAVRVRPGDAAFDGQVELERPRFDPGTFWPLVESQRATYFSAVPAIYAMLSTLPDDVTPDTSSLRIAVCGAAPMPAELIERFE
jgi:acyl-CoA synthetase (AMP-forming)/AMP-acid ligase II